MPPSSPPGSRAVIGEPGGLDVIGAGGGDAAERGAGADGDDVAGKVCELGDEILHRHAGAGLQVKPPAAVRPVNDRAFEAQDVERHGARAHLLDNRIELRAGGLAQGGMPQQPDAGDVERGEEIGLFGADERQRAAAAAARLQPQQVTRHEDRSR